MKLGLLLFTIILLGLVAIDMILLGLVAIGMIMPSFFGFNSDEENIELRKMQRSNIMNKDFSEGFLHDMADVLEHCAKENTDNCDIELQSDDYILIVGLTFKIKEKADEN